MNKGNHSFKRIMGSAIAVSAAVCLPFQGVSADTGSARGAASMNLIRDTSASEGQIQLVSTANQSVQFVIRTEDGIRKLCYQLKNPTTGVFENEFHQVNVPTAESVIEFAAAGIKNTQIIDRQDYVYLAVVCGDLSKEDLEARAKTTSVAGIVLNLANGRVVSSMTMSPAEQKGRKFFFNALPAGNGDECLVAYSAADSFADRTNFKNYMITADGREVELSENAALFSTDTAELSTEPAFLTQDKAASSDSVYAMKAFNRDGVSPEGGEFRFGIDLTDYNRDECPVSYVGYMFGDLFLIAKERPFRVNASGSVTELKCPDSSLLALRSSGDMTVLSNKMNEWPENVDNGLVLEKFEIKETLTVGNDKLICAEITYKNDGTKDEPEVRFVFTDADGNELVQMVKDPETGEYRELEEGEGYKENTLKPGESGTQTVYFKANAAWPAKQEQEIKVVIPESKAGDEGITEKYMYEGPVEPTPGPTPTPDPSPEPTPDPEPTPGGGSTGGSSGSSSGGGYFANWSFNPATSGALSAAEVAQAEAEAIAEKKSEEGKTEEKKTEEKSDTKTDQTTSKDKEISAQPQTEEKEPAEKKKLNLMYVGIPAVIALIAGAAGYETYLTKKRNEKRHRKDD